MKDTIKSLIGIGILLVVVLLIVFFAGNSDVPVEKTNEKTQMNSNDRQDFQRMPDENRTGGPGNFPEDGNMMQFDTESCDELSEGDSCTTTNPMGESMDGTCTIMNENLVCAMERPEGEMPPMQ